MHAAAVALLRGEPVGLNVWSSLWHQLDKQSLDRLDATAVLASLSTQLPDAGTVSALVRSLRPDQTRPVRIGDDPTVNIVGTGGGPGTFNVSTAAALVAAATGVRVIKTGSSAYTSKLGSIDLLRRLGVPITRSSAETAASLGRHGIAFAGNYVYPRELAQLARLVFPQPLTSFSRFLNLLGPLVADVEVDVQLTGVSHHAPADVLRVAGAEAIGRQIWWCSNDLGADELISFAHNRIDRNRIDLSCIDQNRIDQDGVDQAGVGRSAAVIEVLPDLTSGVGSLADLAPVEDPAEAVDDFLELLAGRRNRAATETVALNAAAMIVAAGRPSWPDAYRIAYDAVRDGAAVHLVHELRADRPSRSPVGQGVAGRG